MTTVRVPPGLGTKGTRLWRELHKDHTFDPAETVLVEEACRISDRLDRLNSLLVGEEDAWLKLRAMESGEVVVRIDDALSEARQQANVLKQLVAALRLPDAKTGQRPQQRGGARGAYAASGAVAKRAPGKLGTVTALDRARAAQGN